MPRAFLNILTSYSFTFSHPFTVRVLTVILIFWKEKGLLGGRINISTLITATWFRVCCILYISFCSQRGLYIHTAFWWLMSLQNSPRFYLLHLHQSQMLLQAVSGGADPDFQLLKSLLFLESSFLPGEHTRGIFFSLKNGGISYSSQWSLDRNLADLLLYASLDLSWIAL